MTPLQAPWNKKEDKAVHIVIDLVLLAILIICVWSGYRKGFIIGIANLLGIVVSLYAAVLVSGAFSYDVVPVLRPFVSGYVETQMNDTVLEEMGISNTDLSYEDILANDSELRHQFCYTSYTSVGIYDDAADQMATEAETYANENSVSISEAVIEIFCQRAAYVAGVALMFLIFLIALMAIANIPNLSYRIPNMDVLNDAGGAAMGFINGVCYCILICWALRFLGIIIGTDTLGRTLLARFFIAIDLLTAGVGI